MKYLYTFVIAVLINFSLEAQIVNIPDASFKTILLASRTNNAIAKNAAGNNMRIDANIDGEIQVSEALLVYQLNLNQASSSVFALVADLTGIASFPNLTLLSCTNNQLTSLDVSSNINLTRLDCYNDNLTYLDVSHCPNITNLNCSMNEMTSLNVNNNVNLQYFSCGTNHLTNIDVSNNVNLLWLYCGLNPIASLDVSHNLMLNILSCTYSQITELDIEPNWRITDLACQGNPNLVRLNIKNNERYSYWDNLDFSACPNLRYVCCDEGNLDLVQQKITQNGYPCNANSYCYFEPSGYVVNGISRFDGNSNGCDTSDIGYPNMKFTINTSSSNTQVGTFITRNTGNYSINLPVGNYYIYPSLEVPAYFNVSPVSNYISFSVSTSGPYERNFCVTSNGVYNDLEVVIIPVVRARPGFDAKYKIIYRNKGNQVANGTLNFDFDDNLMDLVSAVPANDATATNSLIWNFSNLNPFETREITLVFNINSPTETPAVNSGDVLPFIATISSGTDETPNDNRFVLNQRVVNSLDPNDKICLEGNSITPSMVGDYVHYTIHFENTGTFAAENIVVADIIDATKFDLTSLVALDGSHPFYTRVIGTGKVEFIFENINLPFDDANNDGYVAFKIKTKPTLVVGDTFSNTANIYFDYNFPIITNTATTTIQTLGNQDFEFTSVFSLSPVPAKNVLNIAAKQSVIISSVTIYNMLGQLIQVNVNPNETIDVSGLKTGSYFIKIISDKGIFSSKFIKE
ncbi:MAG: T9SS type A sorting domain-containing protein [Flavobacterium sp.]|uniref:DUF7619 domain-containing protein n=1 Tax=Flavobacterium sp. TaxID=239 RepID=UPI003265F755